MTPPIVDASLAIALANVLPNRNWQGAPILRKSGRSVMPQDTSAPTNRLLSLPPIPTVTTLAADDSASNCGATPGYCELVMSLDVAPEQLTSVVLSPLAAPTRCG